jgi:putative nucleotidyltransferase with HDIG domain/PAS domain S-box-containing protein
MGDTRPKTISWLAASIALLGWLMLGAYIIYEYKEYGSYVINHFLSPKPTDIIFHLLMLFIPLIFTLMGYLVNERAIFLKKTLQSEKKLEQVLSEWKMIIDSMPIGVMLIDKDFSIIRANAYISKLTGISTKELVSKKCYEVIHKQDKAINNCPLVKSMETLTGETLEYYDSELKKFLRVYCSPLFDENGSIKAFVHSFVDITDLKEKERKLTESRNAFLNMLKDLDMSVKELRGLLNDLVLAFANAIDAKSHWTKGHSERVARYAAEIAKEMGLREKEIETLKTAALLHDIGKIGTYDVILDKPEKLSPEEAALVKQHPVKGVEILTPIKKLQDILPIIKHHHERIDGKGYPDGLKGEEIPLSARILHVADSFDSMTADRPYRPSPGREYAISELKKHSGTQFDPQVVEAFLRILNRQKHNSADSSE